MNSYLVVSSDWHADAVTGGVERWPEVQQLALQAAKHAVELVGEAHRAVFVFAGDLCDPHSPRSHRAVDVAANVADYLGREGLRSIWITGNHDVFEDGSGEHTLMALRSVCGTKVFDRPHVEELWEGGPELAALPFAPASHAYDPVVVVEEWAQLRRPPDVVVGHLNLEGIVPGSEAAEYARGRSVFWPLDALREHLPSAFLIGGHYHKRQRYQSVQIVGSLARLAHGDGAAPGYIVVQL